MLYTVKHCILVKFMNYRQAKYAILLSETGSFSAVAEKLNISQPALSKQILNLESDHLTDHINIFTGTTCY